jgi:HTH-type transcriptional regulator/antitoxin HigA
MTTEGTMNEIRPIRDKAAHRAALAEIERLWGAAPDTPEDDRLDVLMTLVDAYERQEWPDEDLDPVDAIKARMENAGHTRKEFEALSDRQDAPRRSSIAAAT